MKFNILFLLLPLFFLTCACSSTNIRISDYYAKKQDYQTSNEYLDFVLKQDPENYLAYNRKGCNYFRQGNYYSAIKMYDKALQIVPRNKIIVRNRQAALAYLRADQYAIEKLTMVINFRTSESLENYQGHICIK